jgi:S1-C subfamily serine protease
MISRIQDSPENGGNDATVASNMGFRAKRVRAPFFHAARPLPDNESVAMKSRQLILILLLLCAFAYLTSNSSFLQRGHIPLLQRVEGTLPSPLNLTVADAQPAYTPQELTNMSVYKHVLPSVVNVTSSALAFDFFYGVVPAPNEEGSGFVLTRDGRILTNYHVIQNSQKVMVTLADKHQYPAQIVLQDPAHDVALLQIKASNLTPVVLSESKDLQVGQNVYAIGNPFGLNGTMTTGIISSIRSVSEPGGTPIENAIQTDAAINPGNSGGPLLNSRGEVIGMNTLIASNGAEQSSGIGFAIPVDTLKAILSDFSKYGRVRRPSLGIAPLSIGPDLAEQIGLPADYGVLIQRVLPGGAAERAGLHGGTQRAYLGNTPIYLGGDLIVAIDSQQVTSSQDISQIMDTHHTGDTVTVTFFRGQRKMTVSVTLGEAGQMSA